MGTLRPSQRRRAGHPHRGRLGAAGRPAAPRDRLQGSGCANVCIFRAGGRLWGSCVSGCRTGGAHVRSYAQQPRGHARAPGSGCCALRVRRTTRRTSPRETPSVSAPSDRPGDGGRGSGPPAGRGAAGRCGGERATPGPASSLLLRRPRPPGSARAVEVAPLLPPPAAGPPEVGPPPVPSLARSELPVLSRAHAPGGLNSVGVFGAWAGGAASANPPEDPPPHRIRSPHPPLGELRSS